MTEKQFNYIEGLMKKREYEFNNTLAQAFRSGMELNTRDASKLIEFLLSSPEKSVADVELSKVKNVLLKTIHRKKSKKNQAILAEIKKATGIDFWAKHQTNLVNEENVSIISTCLN